MSGDIPTIERLMRELGDGISVLDGGAGKGSFAYRKFPKCRIVALDVQAVTGVDDPPNVERATGDLGALPFADDEFNLVALNFVLEHTLNPEAVLSEIRRVLKPDGIFYFSVPDYRSFDDRLFRFAYKFRHPMSFFKATPDSHNQKFTPDKIRRLIGKFGFQIRTLAKYPGGFSWIPVSLRFRFLRFCRSIGFDPTVNGNFIVRAEQRAVTEELLDVPYVCFNCGTPAIDAEFKGDKWKCGRCGHENICFPSRKQLV